MFPCYSLYPRIADDILLVIDSEKAQTKIARIEQGGSDDTQKDNATIELPWTGHGRKGGRVGFYLSGFTLPSLYGRTPRSRGCIRRGSDFVFFD
jgi:hypothetical protein